MRSLSAILRAGLLTLFAALWLVAPANLGAQNAATINNSSQRTTEPATPSPLPEDQLAPAVPVHLQIADGQTLRIQNIGSGGAPAWLPAVITSLGAVFTSLIALTATLIAVTRSNRQNANNTTLAIQAAAANAQKAIHQKANELEIAEIEKRLSGFFGPFMQLSAENKRIADLLRSRQGNGFRTLTALLDPEWKPSATDRTLVDTIVGNDVELRRLIREKAGPVSPQLMTYLSCASAHFTIIELARTGALKHNKADFATYVYPRQLDRVLQLELDRLVTQRDFLLADLAAPHGPGLELVIPEELALSEQVFSGGAAA